MLGSDKVDKMYENVLSKYQNEEKHPQVWTRGRTAKEKLAARRDRLPGVKRTYQLNVILFTQERRVQPKKGGQARQGSAYRPNSFADRHERGWRPRG